MIIFDLACAEGHSFEGWFRSQEDYELQLQQELISCPVCGTSEVQRVPSAVHLAKKTARRVIEVSADEGIPVLNAQGEMLEAIRQLVTELIANSEDVGKDFASEARRIHYLESPVRAIRGEASAEEFEALRDEGIDVFCIPAVKKEKMN